MDAQEEGVRAYSKLRGLELIEVVHDPGASAGKPLTKREGGRRVLELVRRKSVAAVIAWKLDHLFRDCSDALAVTHEWDRRGVSLHLVDLGGQAVDSSSAMGRFFLTVMAGAAEMERNLVRERTRSTMAHMRTKGKRISRHPPLGFRFENGHLVEDQVEREALRRILELRSDGLSIRAITEQLNSESVPSRGGAWHKTTVHRVLRPNGQ